MRLSSITTSATQPVFEAAHETGAADIRLVDLEAEPGGQEHAERRDDAQEPALPVRRLQDDDHEGDVRPVFGGHVLDDGALLGLGARRRLAAHLPVAEGVLHDALGAAPSRLLKTSPGPKDSGHGAMRTHRDMFTGISPFIAAVARMRSGAAVSSWFRSDHAGGATVKRARRTARMQRMSVFGRL